MLDAALLVVYEGRFREEAVRNQAWTDAQLDKIAGALDAFEAAAGSLGDRVDRSEEHTSELQSLMRISYAVFCLKKKTHNKQHKNTSLPQQNDVTNTRYL